MRVPSILSELSAQINQRSCVIVVDVVSDIWEVKHVRVTELHDEVSDASRHVEIDCKF